MKKIAVILIVLMLGFGAKSQKFNEDSLYTAISNMDDSSVKLANMLEYNSKSDNVIRVKKLALEAVGLSVRLCDAKSEAVAYGHLAWAHCMTNGEFGRARDFWFKALEINDSLGISARKIQNQINIASSFFNENRLGSGIRYLEYAENEVEQSDDKNTLMLILQLKGWAYSRLELFSEAKSIYANMADVCRNNGDSSQMYQAYYGMASNYLRESLRSKDEAFIDSALTLASDVEKYYDGSRHIWMQMYQMFPLIYLEAAKHSKNPGIRKQHLGKANMLCEQGLRLADSTSMNMYKDNIMTAKAELLIYEGKLQEAKRLLDLLPKNITQDARINYLKAVGDYKSLMAEMDRKSISTYRDAAMQQVETIMQSADQQIYEQKKAELEEQTRERQKKDRRLEKLFGIFQRVMYAMVILAVALIGVLAVFWVIFWRHNRMMSSQNETLKHQTDRLEELVTEEDAQNSEIMQQSQTLHTQNKQLEHQLRRLTDGMHYAKRIQDAVIPSNEMMESIFGKCLIYYRPLEIVSGDFYWAVQVNRLRLLAVCDCTGHSVPGALLSILGVSFLNDIISYKNFKAPNAAAVLNVLRRMIIKGIGEECDDGMDMALVIHDQDTGKLHYAGAMRPLYLMRDGEMTVYKPNRMPIGRYIIKEKPFTEQVIDAKPNDRLYMFSDGMTDVFNEDRTNKYSEREFREMLQGFNGMDFASQKDSLSKFYASWGDRAIIDDQLLVGIEL